MQEVLSQGCQCEDFINAKRCLLKSEDELKTLIFFISPLFSVLLLEKQRRENNEFIVLFFTNSLNIIMLKK